MYFDRRLFAMTAGMRGRIALAALIGIVAVPVAVWRLALTGDTIAQVFKGRSLGSLVGAFVLIAALIVLRAALQLWREEIANRTAGVLKVRLRRQLYEKVLALGPGHFDQQRIAGLMTKAVINVLEVVEVEKQYGDALLMPLSVGQCALDAIAEQRAVREPGQRIVQGLMFEFGLELFASGDVGVDAEHGAWPTRRVDFQSPTAGDDDGRTVASRVDELTLPALIADEVGIAEVQFIVAAIDVDALGIEHRPHRAVADQDAVVNGFEKGFQHG